jgi:putative nucleotidyltransferase with HDIG domain
MSVAGLVIVAEALADALTRTPDPRWILLSTLTVGGAIATLKMRAAPASFSIADTFTFTTLLLLGPAPATITAAVEALTISVLLSREQRRPMRVLFNVATVAIAMRVAGWVLVRLTWTDPSTAISRSPAWMMLPVIAAAAVYFVLNTGAVAAAVALEQEQRWVDLWRKHFAHLWLNFFGGAYTAFLFTVFAPSLDIAALLLLMPIPLVLYGVFRMWLGRVNDRLTHLDAANRQYRATIDALAHAIDAKDQVTHGHIRRVQTTSLALARALHWDDEAQLQALEAASLLHDLGKIAIPEHILNKPGRLTDAEYSRMKEHAAIGAQILTGIEFPYPVVPIVRHHHENWAGTGYPDGLAGEAIPAGARILAVVDCYDALTSDRPYRPRLPRDEALQILIDRRGTIYDPRVVDAFVALEPTLKSTTPADHPPMTNAGMDRHRREQSPISTMEQLVPDRFGHAAEPILALACERLSASAGVLFAYDEPTHSLRAAITFGPASRALRDVEIELGQRLSGWVGATRSPQLNADPRLDLHSDASIAGDLRAALSVPVERDAALMGVLTLYATESNSFTPTDLEVLMVLGSLVADARLTRSPESVPIRTGGT